MPKNKINSINNELKSYINEATGISNKCKMKLISLVQKHFYVDLPNDNFLNIDITILDNGNISFKLQNDNDSLSYFENQSDIEKEENFFKELDSDSHENIIDKSKDGQFGKVKKYIFYF